MVRSPRARVVRMVPVGGSMGVRLPEALMDRYGWGEWLIMEETADRSAFDVAAADGLD